MNICIVCLARICLPSKSVLIYILNISDQFKISRAEHQMNSDHKPKYSGPSSHLSELARVSKACSSNDGTLFLYTKNKEFPRYTQLRKLTECLSFMLEILSQSSLRYHSENCFFFFFMGFCFPSTTPSISWLENDNWRTGSLRVLLATVFLADAWRY